MDAFSWRVVATSLTGSSHLSRGTECQDAHRHVRLDGGQVVLAVADGAGSARRSAEGSSLATGIALAVLEEALCGRRCPTTGTEWTALGWHALRETAARFLTAARGLSGKGATYKEFATTLSIAVLSGDWTVYAGVGDGFMVTQNHDGRLFLAIPPRQHGEYRNEAAFLTTDGWEDYAEVRAFWEPERTAVALSTDGLVDAVLEKRPAPGGPRKQPATPYPQFFSSVFQHAANPDFNPRELYREMMDPQFDKATGDDRTLLLAVRR
jgi:hypothetical protein